MTNIDIFKEQLSDFAIWMFNQRAVDIEFYGVNCIPKLVELYLEEKNEIQ